MDTRAGKDAAWRVAIAMALATAGLAIGATAAAASTAATPGVQAQVQEAAAWQTIQTGPEQAQARAADVSTVDGIVAALYDVISGDAGQPRDWNRMRSLFAPEGRMQVVAPRPDGTVALRTLTIEDYIARNDKAFATMGFFEREAARTAEVFGQVAHVFSTYESRHARGDAKPFQRGINSIQLVNDGARWWVVNLVWRAEDAKLPLPERYLPKR
jgi:hypothetical protein